MAARTVLFATAVFLVAVLSFPLASGASWSASIQVPILLYHRFASVAANPMTITTPLFESHLRYLKDNGYTVLPLRQFVDYRLGKALLPPPRSVVITVDDGHQSVYTRMFPLVLQYHVPVTLFIYPSAISNAAYALSWEQLQELRESGLFEVQSHSYWHPNFNREKRNLTPEAYEKFVEMQFIKSKETLERRLSIQVNMLAWPFGIYDDELIGKATRAGYVAAFTLERRHASASDPVMALPRYLVTDGEREKMFERLLWGRSSPPEVEG